MFNSLGLGLTRRKRNKLVTILLSSTSAYAILDFEPDFVLDFKNSIYKTGGTDTTLSSAVTHARAGNATMVDSDGLLKWSPHNLLSSSEELNLWTQAGAGSVVVDNAVAPDGTTTAATLTFGSTNFQRYINSFGAYTTGDKITFSFYARSDTVTTLPFGINGGTNGNNNTIFSDVAVTSAWNLVEFEFTILGNDTSLYYIIGKQSSNPVAGQLGDVEIWHPHAYRSDLGGMVNNPTTGDSYVPTTSSAVYLPRVGHHVYNGSAWVNEGILHESEARTNLLPTSTTLASWSKLNVNASLSTVTSPSGNQDAVLVKPTAGTHSFTFLWYTAQYNTGVITSMSVFAKASGKDFMTMLNSSGSTNYASFNLSTGAVSNVTSGYTANMEDFGNGWYRCSVVTPTGFNERAIFAVADANNSATSTANGEDGILLYGPQLEAGSTPSSYIPTSDSQVTRAAETLTVPAANLPYSSTNMSFQMDGKMSWTDENISVNKTMFSWSSDASNFIRGYMDTGGALTGRVVLQSKASGVDDFSAKGSDDYTVGTNVAFNISSRHGSSFLNHATDGTALTANTTPTALPNLSSSTLSLGFDFMGTIGKFRMWDEDLGDTGIEEAST